MSFKTYLNPESIEGGTINRTHINVKPNDPNNLLASTDNPGVVQLSNDRYSSYSDRVPTASVISQIDADIEFISRGNLCNSIKPIIGAVLKDDSNNVYTYSGALTRAYLKLVGCFNIKLNDGYYFSKIVTLAKDGTLISFNEYGIDDNIYEEYIADNYGDITFLYEIAERSNTNISNNIDRVIKYITFDCINLGKGNKSYDIDNYIGMGEYVICGSSNKCLHLPITNNGYIHGNLKVISDIDTATQILILLNVGGGDGNIYTRTYQNGVWETWGKMQTNVEVGLIDEEQMKALRDNGMYSGILLSTYETFVLVVINNYAIAALTGSAGYVSQLKYSVDTSGNVIVKTRRSDAYGFWSDWDDVDGVTEYVIDFQGHGGKLEKYIKPNKYYKIVNVCGELYIYFENESNSKLNNYMFEVTFDSGNTLVLSEDIKWANGVTPQICKEGGTYQISVINKLGIITEFNEI